MLDLLELRTMQVYKPDRQSFSVIVVASSLPCRPDTCCAWNGGQIEQASEILSDAQDWWSQDLPWEPGEVIPYGETGMEMRS